METLLSFFDPSTIDVALKLFWAMFFGMIIGTERLFAHKTAGLRTYALVSMGAALFVIISNLVGQNLEQSFDPLRMAAQIVTGIGFLGAGMVIVHKSHVLGLTSATGMWVAAGIGMATGFGLYGVAIITTFLTLFIFIVLWFIEQQLKKTQLFEDGVTLDK